MRPRYAIPLIALIVLTVFTILSNVEEETKERGDPYLLFFIGITFTICMTITLIFTRSWTLRSAGVLMTMAGDGVLYSVAGGQHFVSMAPETIGHVADLARSCFVVGGITLLIGLGIWLWRVRHPPPEPLGDPIDLSQEESAGAP